MSTPEGWQWDGNEMTSAWHWPGKGEVRGAHAMYAQDAAHSEASAPRCRTIWFVDLGDGEDRLDLEAEAFEQKTVHVHRQVPDPANEPEYPDSSARGIANCCVGSFVIIHFQTVCYSGSVVEHTMLFNNPSAPILLPRSAVPNFAEFGEPPHHLLVAAVKKAFRPLSNTFRSCARLRVMQQSSRCCFI